MLKLKGKPRWEASKSIFWGAVITGVLFAFWYGIFGNPLDEYSIMMYGEEVTASVHDCTREIAESDSQPSGPYSRCVYSYEVNGKTYSGAGDFPDLAPDTTEIRYMPKDPSVHREKQGAASSFGDWLFRKVILGIVLLLMFVAAPIKFTYNGIKDFIKNEVSME